MQILCLPHDISLWLPYRKHGDSLHKSPSKPLQESTRIIGHATADLCLWLENLPGSNNKTRLTPGLLYNFIREHQPSEGFLEDSYLGNWVVLHALERPQHKSWSQGSSSRKQALCWPGYGKTRLRKISLEACISGSCPGQHPTGVPGLNGCLSDCINTLLVAATCWEEESACSWGHISPLGRAERCEGRLIPVELQQATSHAKVHVLHCMYWSLTFPSFSSIFWPPCFWLLSAQQVCSGRSHRTSDSHTCTCWNQQVVPTHTWTVEGNLSAGKAGFGSQTRISTWEWG